jgi:hypothetical protein
MIHMLGVVLGLLALLVIGMVWFNWRGRVQVPCTIDIERTHEHLHAHVDLEGVLIEPGDAVLVEGAPSHVAYGARDTRKGQAVVRRASRLRRWWTRLIGPFEVYELYDVGFE